LFDGGEDIRLGIKNVPAVKAVVVLIKSLLVFFMVGMALII